MKEVIQETLKIANCFVFITKFYFFCILFFLLAGVDILIEPDLKKKTRFSKIIKKWNHKVIV